ncbi:hypothetical protein MRB53_030753, partial [Persea americana]
MADYIQQFKVIIDQLAASASPISEDELLYAVLDGLPSAYRPLQSVIRARALVPCPLKKFTTSSYVRSLVLQMILRKIPLLQHLLSLDLQLSSLLDLALMVVVRPIFSNASNLDHVGPSTPPILAPLNHPQDIKLV